MSPAPFLIAFLLATPGDAPPTPAIGRVLAPGFQVDELPVKLTNQNGLVFTPQGLLISAGYDGRFHTLRDTDGDGLPETHGSFWDRPTILTPIGLAWVPGEGLYVASHRKISLLRDADGDGRAEGEEVIAEGWPPILNVGGNVDALGLARAPDGSLYFGLGTANYANAYQLDEQGKPHYDIRSERGTILRIAPDRKSRAIVCTGIRFPYALRFNRAGDLFATDQEGATWLPGGNPLDELDHIQPGRHYGFPPRHPDHLPDVADEPPVIGFGPQHQSACGMAFNDPDAGQKPFGPAAWTGDALVCLFSRGRIARARLVKTPAGYVGQSTALAVLDQMPSDAAIAPWGDLFVATHGGPPDWGTGPRGEGRLLRIRYRDPDAPQVAAAWAAGPLEVRVAFDRPIDETDAARLAGRPIPFGRSVQPADELETHKPPYEVVKQQQLAPRGALRIASARLDDSGRTLVLTTDPHPWQATYALTIPGRGSDALAPGRGSWTLGYDLSGIEASWIAGADAPDDAEPAWSLWWPHLDPRVTAALTRGSAAHDHALADLARPGRLTLRGLIQPDPQAPLTLILAANTAFEAGLYGELAAAEADASGQFIARLVIEPAADPADLTLIVPTGTVAGEQTLHAALRPDGAPQDQPLPTARLLPPWVPAPAPSLADAPAVPDDLAGGDPVNGRAVFFSDEAKCSACHQAQGQGGRIGPDLGNLGHRDLASIHRDIADPSAVIHPDFLTYTVALKDGRVAVGVVRAVDADTIRVLDTNAKETLIPRAEIDQMQPSRTSVMPVGLAGALGPEKLRDLLAYLRQAGATPTNPPASAPPPINR
jgi:putative heme-binding domain-containing protein